MANFQKIKELCEKKKIRMKDLAKSVGIEAGTLSTIIKSGATTTERIEKIAKELGVSAAIFFDDGAVNVNNGVGHVGNGNNGNIMLSQCQYEVDMLKQQLQDKNEIILLLKQQLKSKK